MEPWPRADGVLGRHRDCARGGDPAVEGAGGLQGARQSPRPGHGRCHRATSPAGQPSAESGAPGRTAPAPGAPELGRDPWVISGAQAAAGPVPAVRSVDRDPGWILPLSVFILSFIVFLDSICYALKDSFPLRTLGRENTLTDKETEAQRCSNLQSGLDLNALGQHVRSGSQPGREQARHVLLCPGPDRWRGPRGCCAGVQAAVGGGKPPRWLHLPRSQGCAGHRQPNLGASGNSSAPTSDLPPRTFVFARSRGPPPAVKPEPRAGAPRGTTSSLVGVRGREAARQPSASSSSRRRRRKC